MVKTTKTKLKLENKVEEVKPNFSITLKIGNEVFKGQGQTALDALQAIPRPLKILEKGTFQITDGVKSSREVFMLPIRLRRLFYGKLSQQIQLKSLCYGMR